MKRTKWMRAQFPGTTRQIAKQLQRDGFSEESGRGFLVDRVRDDYLEARYIEKVSFQESVHDPFGATIMIERLSYREIDFTLAKTFPELELRMAPRGLGGFTGGLLKASGFSMELENHKVSTERWTRAIERQIGVKIAMRSVLVGGLELAEGAQARVVFSAPNDVRPGIKELLGGRRYTVDTVQIEYPVNGSNHRVVIGSDSTVRYGERFPPEELEAIKVALQSVVQ
jgi:hypothetical protein